jgi:hypothetical protein
MISHLIMGHCPPDYVVIDIGRTTGMSQVWDQTLTTPGSARWNTPRSTSAVTEWMAKPVIGLASPVFNHLNRGRRLSDLVVVDIRERTKRN